MEPQQEDNKRDRNRRRNGRRERNGERGRQKQRCSYSNELAHMIVGDDK